MAYAGVKFTNSLLQAMNGEDVTECCLVASDVSEAKYFANPIVLSVSNNTNKILKITPDSCSFLFIMLFSENEQDTESL